MIMNWTKVSSIAEILGSAAVVVTLIFLTIQVRQNTAALQTSSRQATAHSDVDLLMEVSRRPELWLDGYKETLTDAESTQLNAYLFAVMRIRELDWLEYQAGALDEVTWKSYQSGMISRLSKLNTRKWWDYNSKRHKFVQGFTETVDALLRNVPVDTANNEMQAFQ
jgi:hypothetical protein